MFSCSWITCTKSTRFWQLGLVYLIKQNYDPNTNCWEYITSNNIFLKIRRINKVYDATYFPIVGWQIKLDFLWINTCKKITIYLSHLKMQLFNTSKSAEDILIVLITTSQSVLIFKVDKWLFKEFSYTALSIVFISRSIHAGLALHKHC